MLFPAGNGWFALDSVDLTGVSSVTLTCGWQAPPKMPLNFEVRLDAPDGKVLGKAVLTPPPVSKGPAFLTLPLGAVTDGSQHAIYFLYKGVEPISGGILSLTFNPK